jgi:perosamine synthetase
MSKGKIVTELKSQLDLRQVVDLIRSCLPRHLKSVKLHEPFFDGHEWNYVRECIDTGWVSSAGSFVDRFERELSQATGISHAVAVVNGTAALHLALKLVGVSQGDEVLVPTLAFVAAANATTYCGAIPHFVDCDERTLGIDPKKLSEWLEDVAQVKEGQCVNQRTGRTIKAVVAVHTFGHPVDLDELCVVCDRYHLELIEDAAEALGSYYKGRHVGGCGRISVLSFNGNKTVTTGGGGAILTKEETLATAAKHLSTTAKVNHPWAYRHDEVGFNYRMPNLNAALGCAQLEQLDTFVQRKRKLAERYEKAFAGVSGLRFFREPDFAKSNYWLNSLVLDEDMTEWRDRLLTATNENGLMTRPVWTLLNKLPMFSGCEQMDLSVSESLEARVLNIPSSAFLYE